MSRKRKHALDKKNDILKHLEKGEKLVLLPRKEMLAVQLYMT